MAPDRAQKRLFTTLALVVSALPAVAQTYTFSDCKNGATLTVKIDSLASTSGPYQVSGGHSITIIFFADFALTVKGKTQTYSSVLTGGSLNYTPSIGNLTQFGIRSQDPSVPLVANLQATGDLIPDGNFPQTLPPLSSWNVPTSDYIQYGNPTVMDRLDTLGACTVAAAPTITNVITAGAFGAFPAITPGTWIEIYGTNLAPDTRPWATSDFNGPNAPTSLDRVQVTVNGQSAFISYIASNPGQIDAQIPYTIPVNQTVQVTVINNGVPSAPFNMTSSGILPGMLAPGSFNIGGKQYVTALLPDGATYILPTGAISGVVSRPAKPGETIVLYGIGFGLVTPATSAGEIAQGNTRTLLPLQILFGQTPAQITYEGLAPGFVGLYQFDVVVPSVPDSDLVPLTVMLDTVASKQTLYIAVHQ